MSKSEVAQAARESLRRRQQEMSPEERAEQLFKVRARGLNIARARNPELSERALIKLLQRRRAKRNVGRRPSNTNRS